MMSSKEYAERCRSTVFLEELKRGIIIIIIVPFHTSSCTASITCGKITPTLVKMLSILDLRFK
jgi:hypothetical protein